MRQGKMTTIYLHIGTHKTGTTALQNFLFRNREELLSKGFLYPKSARPGGSRGHHNLAWSVKKAKRYDPLAGSWKEIQKEINRLSPDNVVLSSEEFEIKDFDRVSLVKSHLERYRTKIVVYLRRQDDFFQSVYVQNVKGGISLNIHEFIQKIQYRGDYYELLKPWRDLFGKENIIVRIYEKEKLANGGLYEDFMSSVGIETNEKYEQPRGLINFSPEPKIVELIRLLNEIVWKGKFSFSKQDRLNLYVKPLLENIDGEQAINKDTILSAKERIDIINEFKASNQKVAQEYLGQENLFTAELPDLNKPEARFNEFNHKQLRDLLLSLEKQSKDLRLRQLINFLDINPAFITSSEKGIAEYLDEGILLKKEGKFDTAIEKFHKALQLEPNSISILNHLAGIYQKLYLKKDRDTLKQNEQLEEIVEIYYKLIELNPNKAEGYFGMGHILLAQKKWGEAIEYFIETLKRNPNWNQVYRSLAYALKQQKNINRREIRLCYKKAIIPKVIIRKVYDFKKQDLIKLRETASDLKYIEVEEVEPFLEQKTEKTFVVILGNGRACRNLVNHPNDAVISSSNKVVKEVSGANSQLIFYAQKLNQPLEFDKAIAYLQGISINNYYHWLLQVIPQICLLRRVGINLDTIEKFAFFRLPMGLPFQQETLSLLNVPKSKIIETFKHPYIKAKKLIVTSPIKIAPTRKLACDLVRYEFANKKLIKSIDKSNRIYISRKKASSRKIINENQLTTLLANFGFRTFCLESMSFLEEVDLFSEAEIVVAAHGAGLTNLIFCKPGIKVIEIFPPNHTSICYQSICSYYDFNYYSLIAEHVDNAQAQREVRNQRKDINVNINSLLDVMKLAEII